MKNSKRIPLCIQLFADDTVNQPTDGDKSVQTGDKEPENKPATFDEMLAKENYQSEFDKRVAKALETSKTKWEADAKVKAQEEKNEAERLAKMNAEEKAKHLQEQAEAKAKEYEAKLNAYELKDQALTIAKEKSLDVSLLELIDFTKETAESVSTKIDNIKKTFDTAVAKALSDKLKEKSPRQYDNPGNKDDDDPYIRGFKNFK